MCARTVFKGKIYRPGDVIVVQSAAKQGKAKWTGFARSETVQSVWGPDWIPLDVPAERFAENNRNTGNLTWGDVDGVVFGVGNRKTGEAKILTREATSYEKMYFGHHRLPCIGAKRFYDA